MGKAPQPPRRILVTGATGTVGQEVLRQLRATGCEAVAGVTARHAGDPDLTPTMPIDFAAGPPADTAFGAIFLMRPPAMADPPPFARFLEPFARETRVVFLSVAGADRAAYLPHAKIEAVIADKGFASVFIRPVYFMDNLITTLRDDLKDGGEIVLPSGDLPFDWVSARDVAALAVRALLSDAPPRVMTAAGGGHMGFAEICTRVNAALGTDLRYRPVGALRYVARCRRRGLGWPQIGVMLLLHWLPRFGRKSPPARDEVEAILGRPAETPEEFALRNAGTFRALLDGTDG